MSVDDGLLRLKMQNGEMGVIRAAKHNKRQLASHKDADSSLSHLNKILRGPSTAEEVDALAKYLREAAGIHKLKRKDNITAIEIISSLPIGSSIDPMRYFEDFVQFLERRFGQASILSADAHFDESAKHCHVLISPILNNKLDASGIVGGPQRVNDLQNAFFAEVGIKYGLRRPKPKLSGKAKETAGKLVIDRLIEDGDTAVVSSVWEKICESIRRYPDPFVSALGIDLPKKPAKTLEQIALSSGAGPKTSAGEASRDRHLDRLNRTPIGVHSDRSGSQPLPCGGVGLIPEASLPTRQQQDTEPVPALGGDDQASKVRHAADQSPPLHPLRTPHTDDGNADDLRLTPRTFHGDHTVKLDISSTEDITRERHGCIPSERWNHDLGEFIQEAPVSRMHGKVFARAEVARLLQRQG